MSKADGLSLTMEKYIQQRNSLIEKEKEEWVSECCGAHVSDTDIEICPTCLDHCNFINLNEEKQ